MYVCTCSHITTTLLECSYTFYNTFYMLVLSVSAIGVGHRNNG